MKIIANASTHHDSKFIVEMSEDEMARAAGFCNSHDSAWKARVPRYWVGSEIQVSVAYSYHRRVMEHQASAASAANTLRALADLIGGALPEVVIPPIEAKTEGAEA